jgi:predicted alpha-1,6-mannanase (GH76 family)
MHRVRIAGFGVTAMAAALLLLLAQVPARADAVPVPNYRADAIAAVRVLQAWYNPSTGLYATTGWWEAANAVNAVVDYSRLTGDRSYLDEVANTFTKAAARPPCGRYTVWCTYGHFLDNYFDDDGWWALTWVNAYDLTHDQRYLQMSETMFSYITQGWDSTCGGGVWWNVFDNYKNAIPNELFLQLAAELYQRTGDPSYLGWAMREWTWFRQSGMINAAHLVNDGLTLSTCQNNGGTTWTYNQGVILGGLSALYQITHDPSYLQAAQAIADAATHTLTDANGILTEPCATANCGNGSAVQFKGIFERNLYRLYQASLTPAYRDFIERNATSIWTHDRSSQDQLGLRWQGPFDAADASIPFIRPAAGGGG